MLKSREIRRVGYFFLGFFLFCSPLLAKTEYFASPKPQWHKAGNQKAKPETINIVVDGGKVPVDVWVDSVPSYPYRILGLIETNRQRKHAARVAVEHGANGIVLLKREEIPYVPRWVGRHRGTLRFSEFRYWWAIKR